MNNRASMYTQICKRLYVCEAFDKVYRIAKITERDHFVRGLLLLSIRRKIKGFSFYS